MPKTLQQVKDEVIERIAKMRSLGMEISPASQEIILKEVSLAFSSGVHTTEERVREMIEGMKKEPHSHKDCDNFSDCQKFSLYEKSYNQALSDLLSSLTSNSTQE